jgi:S1-C subfamily serine protease
MDKTTASVCVLAVSLAAATLDAQTSGTRFERTGFSPRFDELVLEAPGPESGATVRNLGLAEKHDLRRGAGVVVRSVDPDSPAARAGLVAGDIVVEIDRMPVADAKHFDWVLRHTPRERLVLVGVVRDGARRTLLLLL